MSIDYAKKERAFLSHLKSETGHTLEEWLQRIDAERLSHRNDIIDWLRHHGFTFSDASWLERIHHNGGRPIYADPLDEPKVVPLTRDAPPSPELHHDQNSALPENQKPHLSSRAADLRDAEPDTSQRRASTESAPQSGPGGDDVAGAHVDDLETVLAGAKGLRPLAQHIMREMQKAAPNAQVICTKSALSFLIDGKAFALLTLAPKALKLGLALSGERPAAPFEAPKFNPAPALPTQAMTHMLELNDVRQFDNAVLVKIQEAAERA